MTSRPSPAVAVIIPPRISGGSRQRCAASRPRDTRPLLIRALAPGRWLAFAKPGKKLKIGDTLGFDGLEGKVVARHDDGSIEIAFDRDGAALAAAHGLGAYAAAAQAVVAWAASSGEGPSDRLQDH